LELYEQHSAEIPHLIVAVQTHKTVSHPLVAGFMTEWAQNTNWGIRPPLHFDALRLDVPQQLIESLAATGGVEAFSLLIGDLGGFYSARMQSGDSHAEYRLIVNAPAWLQVALAKRHQDCFERQLKNVIQHEMSHFRHVKSGDRVETHAHCRGIAAVLPRGFAWETAETLRALLQTDYPEFVHNQEVQSLVLNGSAVPLRLIRRWQWLFATTRQQG
jgi:hypothetical protein